MWTLCVILHVSQQVTCFDERPYAVESECWDAARVWTWRALAWSHRSHIPPSDSAWCLTPEEMKYLNPFKKVER